MRKHDIRRSSTLRADWFVIWFAMILPWLLFSSLDSSVIVVPNSTFRALCVISTNDCVVKVDSSTIFWENTFWNIRSIFLIDVVVNSFDSVTNVAWLTRSEIADLLKFSKEKDFEVSVNFAVWVNFEFSMKSMIDFDWIGFDSSWLDDEKTELKFWFESSYDRDLKFFIENRTLDVISKFERAKVSEDAMNDRVLALSFRIRSTMLNWSIRSNEDNVSDNFSVEFAKVEVDDVLIVMMIALNDCRKCFETKLLERFAFFSSLITTLRNSDLSIAHVCDHVEWDDFFLRLSERVRDFIDESWSECKFEEVFLTIWKRWSFVVWSIILLNLWFVLKNCCIWKSSSKRELMQNAILITSRSWCLNSRQNEINSRYH